MNLFLLATTRIYRHNFLQALLLSFGYITCPCSPWLLAVHPERRRWGGGGGGGNAVLVYDARTKSQNKLSRRSGDTGICSYVEACLILQRLPIYFFSTISVCYE